MMNTEVKEVTVKKLVKAFEGKYVNISPMDHYGISINMRKATLELEDDNPDLYFVSRDENNNVVDAICISEEVIESIEEYEDTYTIHFALDMTSVDISEYRDFNVK